MRLAIVYDAGDREGTTGGYLLRAARSLGLDVVRWTLAEAAHMPPLDLHVRVDHGDEYEVPWPARLRPAVFYAIDTHLPHSWRKIRRTAGWYDLVACCHRSGAERLPGAVWLPVACDPDLHAGSAGAPRDLDIAFIGTDGGVPRKFYLQALRERYPNSFISLAPHTQLAATYGRARIGFNYAIRDDVNMRVFEVMAAGALLLTNVLSHDDLDRLGLRAEEHLVTYDGPRELFDRIERLLSDAPERERIAAAGRAAVLGHHTYRHRMEELLRIVQEQLGVRLLPEQSVVRSPKSVATDFGLRTSD